MIKLVYCFRKKPGMSDEDFSSYWQNVHGAIAKRIPGLQKLMQSVTVRSSADAYPPAFDGMAELWFEDWDALLKARQSRAWQEISADEVNFMDTENTAYFVTVERQIVSRSGE